jgi:hypothetical protein
VDVLRRALVAGAVATLVGLAACSGPDPYKGGGRLLTLPGQEGGSALVASEGGAPPPIDAGPEDASTPEDDAGDANFINPLLPDALFDAP